MDLFPNINKVTVLVDKEPAGVEEERGQGSARRFPAYGISGQDIAFLRPLNVLTVITHESMRNIDNALPAPVTSPDPPRHRL